MVVSDEDELSSELASVLAVELLLLSDCDCDEEIVLSVEPSEVFAVESDPVESVVESEPLLVLSVEDESVEDEPVEDESVEDESVEDESVEPEFVEDESVEDESTEDESVEAESVGVESVEAESVMLEPSVEAESVEAESVDAESVEAESVVAVLSSSPLPSVPPNLSASLASPEPSTVETGNRTNNGNVKLLHVHFVVAIKNYLKYL